MRKIALPILLLLAGCASLAYAATAEWTATADVNQNGVLYTMFKDAVPAGTGVTYTLGASGTATYGCLANNYSWKKGIRQLLPSQDSPNIGPWTSEATFYSRRGAINAGVALMPPDWPDGPTDYAQACAAKGGSTHLVEVSYTNVMLTSTAHAAPAILTGNCAGTNGCTDILLPGK